MSPTPPPEAPTADPGEGAGLAGQVEQWRRSLLDLTKRNRLLNCPVGSRGALELVHPGPSKIYSGIVTRGGTLTFPWRRELLEGDDEDSEERYALLAQPDESGDGLTPAGKDLERCPLSPHLRPDHVLADLPDKKLGNRLYRLSSTSRTSLTETGVHCLYLGFGLLRWFESPTSEKELLAPLLLVPVDLKREGADAPWLLSLYEDTVSTNFTLAKVMEREFGLQLPTFEEGEVPEDHQDYLERVREIVRSARRWEVLNRVVLSSFSFQKVAMWLDLGTNKERIAKHVVCRGIAGEDASELRRVFGTVPSPKDFDHLVRPSDVHQILDADSSQLEAILAAKAGANLVIDGPPGTGKSQTIANIITEFLADNKTVLFVSEKAAALDVVKRRLDSRKLGDFCLECHSHKSNKKLVVSELGRVLALDQESYKDQSDRLERLYDVRRELNAYVRALHSAKGALNATAYQVHGWLSRLHPKTTTRCSIENVLQITPGQLERYREALQALQGQADVVSAIHAHPWRGCLLTTYALSAEDDAKHHLGELATRLRDLTTPLKGLIDLGFVTPETGVAGAMRGMQLAAQASRFPLVPASWFRKNPGQIASQVIGLDSVARLWREQQAALADYVPTAAASHDPAEAARLLSPSRWVDRVLPFTTKTARTLLAGLRGAAAAAAELRSAAMGVHKTSRELAQRLHAPAPEHARAVRRLAEVGRLVATIEAPRRSWFDPSQRARLTRQATEYEARRLKIEALAESLESEGIRDPRAMETHQVAVDAIQYESWWRRLFGWGGFRKRRLAPLYSTGVCPATAPALAHLKAIRELSAELEQYDRALQDHEADLPTGKQAGLSPWVDLSGELRKLDELAAIVVLTTGQVEALLRPGEVDRDHVARIARALDRALVTFDAALARLLERCDAETAAGDLGVEYLPANDLDQLLALALETFDERTALLDRWVGLLREGHDPPWERLPQDQANLARSRQLQAEATQLLSQLEGCVPAEATPWAKDWSATKELALWVQSFLERSRNRPLPLLVEVATNREKANRLRAAVPPATAARDAFQRQWERLGKLFPLEEEVSTGIRLDQAPLQELLGWVEARPGDVARMREWITFKQTERRLSDLGLGALLAEVFEKRVDLAEAVDAFLARFYRDWLGAIYAQDPVLSGFDPKQHEGLIQQFRELDRETISGGYKRIRSRLLLDPDRPHDGLDAPSSSEVAVLLSEVNKKRRHLPLRQLFKRIPTLLTKLKPCVMMSPLAVSTFLDSDQILFDVVIFDEASQILPEDAIGAIYRGRQLIVAGDQKQLPPSSFFKAADDDGAQEDEEEDQLADFESVLDVCCSKGLLRKRLRWHYRSRRESLIAFSNHHIYDNELVTFPSVFDTRGPGAVRLIHVPDGRWQNRTNPAEARKVAELVFEHFRRTPERSLGVVAFSADQQFAIEAELERERRANPEMEPFFDAEQERPFFVKNLENVQGDERDVIIISVAYARGPDGRPVSRFGPLNPKGGERRLNVLVTRAIEEVLVVSSIRSHDVKLTPSRGVQLLHAYLEYAERGVEALARQVSVDPAAEADSPFETEVAQALRGMGFEVSLQVGCSGFKIDIGLLHPEQKGRFVLGVECDGATYHSSHTARDRDRLRQEILESLGWRIVRIWSTEWVRDPGRQLQRVKQAFYERLAELTSGGAEPSPKPADPEEEPLVKFPASFRRGPQKHNFQKIEDVPSRVAEETFIEALRLYGATDRDELLKQVATSLGFARLGKKIRERLESCLTSLLRDERVLFDASSGVVRPPR